MNYGKKGAKKRQSELTSKGVVFRKKLHVTFCKALLVCFFAVVIIAEALDSVSLKVFWTQRHSIG